MDHKAAFARLDEGLQLALEQAEGAPTTLAERSRLTREALADVDAGRVIDHQAVQAWAESLSTNAPLAVPR